MSKTTDAEPQVTVRFAPKIFKGLQAFAADKELDLPGAIEAIVREGVSVYMNKSDRRQVEAEAEVMDFVNATVLERRDAGDWDSNIIYDVFKKIKEIKLDAYGDAVDGEPRASGNHAKARINRRIGAQVKRLLGAEVVIEGGRRAKGQPSRAENALVMSYSLLKRLS